MVVERTIFLVKRCQFLRYELSIFSRRSIRYEIVTHGVVFVFNVRAMVPLTLERLRSLKCCN